MKKGLSIVILLAVLLGLLVTLPVLGSQTSSVLADEASTMFPRSGDSIMLEEAPYWKTGGDHAEAWRTFADLPEVGRLEYDLVLSDNSLNSGGQCDFTLYVNNKSVGRFTVVEGETSKHLDFSFESIPGPSYKLYLELMSNVGSGKGWVTVALNRSRLTLYATGTTPTSTPTPTKTPTPRPTSTPDECSARMALSSREDKGSLDLLRRFRDDLLVPNPVMRKHLDTYYALAPEAASILTSHPLLLARSANTLRMALPYVGALLDGHGDEMYVPAEDLQTAYRLLEDGAELSSPEARLALKELRSMLELFEGRTVTEAWHLMPGP